MTSSAIYSRTAIEIVKRALKLIRVVDAELPIESQDRENGFDALNGFVKYLQTEGFNLWRETEALLPLVKGQQSYLLGPTGDHAFDDDDFISTTLSADQITSDVLLNLTSTTGMVAAPDILDSNPTITTQGWTVTNGTIAIVNSRLVLTNTTKAYVDYSLVTEVGKTYILQAEYVQGSAANADFEIRDIDGLIICSNLAACGTARLEFTARQTSTTFRFQNGLGTTGLKNTLSNLNYIDKSAGDKIGVFLDDATIQWSNIIYLSPFEVAAGLTSAASSGNTIYTYTNLIPRPMSITNARYRQTLGFNDTPTTDWSRVRYFEQPDKASQGTLTKWYYTPQLGDGKLYVWQPSSSNAALMPFTYVRPLDVTDDNADTLDFPSEWYDLLSFGTGNNLLAEYSAPEGVIARVATRYQELLEQALGFDNDGYVSIEIDYEGRR